MFSAVTRADRRWLAFEFTDFERPRSPPSDEPSTRSIRPGRPPQPALRRSNSPSRTSDGPRTRLIAAEGPPLESSSTGPNRRGRRYPHDGQHSPWGPPISGSLRSARRQSSGRTPLRRGPHRSSCAARTTCAVPEARAAPSRVAWRGVLLRPAERAGPGQADGAKLDGGVARGAPCGPPPVAGEPGRAGREAVRVPQVRAGRRGACEEAAEGRVLAAGRPRA